LRSEISEIE